MKKNNLSHKNFTHNKFNKKLNLQMNNTLLAKQVCVFNSNNFFSLSVGKNYIHTGSILKSSRVTNEATNVNVPNTDNILEQLKERSVRIERERLTELLKIQYKDKYGTDATSESEVNMSSYGESFPWFVDSEGKVFDYNKSIKLFDGIKIVSRYLETRFGMENSTISEVKINEILKPFENGADVTVLDLFEHIQKIYAKDEDFFKNLKDQMIQDPEGSRESQNSSNLLENFRKDFSNANKPLGEQGEITLNEIIVKLKDLKWEAIHNNMKVTVNPVPTAINLIGYNLLLRSYMKYVHNRPFENNLSIDESKYQKGIRRRNLAAFVLVGAPLILFGLKTFAIPLKDFGSIEVLTGKSNSSESFATSKVSTSGLFLILSKLNDRVPDLVKLIFKLFLFILIVLKLFGLNLIDIFMNVNYLRIYSYLSVSVVIMYQLLNLYLLYLFSKKNIKIFEFLPEFLINWLKEFEYMSKTQDRIKAYKNMCYIELFLYICILIFLFICLQ